MAMVTGPAKPVSDLAPPITKVPEASMVVNSEIGTEDFTSVEIVFMKEVKLWHGREWGIHAS